MKELQVDIFYSSNTNFFPVSGNDFSPDEFLIEKGYLEELCMKNLILPRRKFVDALANVLCAPHHKSANTVLSMIK